MQRQVEVSLPARERPDRPALRLHGDHRRGGIVLPAQDLSRLLDGRLLKLRVHGGVDAEPAEAHGLGSDLILEFQAHFFEERGEVRVFGGRVGGELELRCEGFFVLGGGDHALLAHQAEHPVAAGGRLLDERLALPGGVGGRRVEEPGEGRGLGEGGLIRALAEVALGGPLGAVGAVAVVHGVQVGGQDLLFGVAALVGEGERGLHEPSAEGDVEPLVLVHEQVLHELFADGGATLLHLPRPQVRPSRPPEPLEVDPEVLVEPAVLDGDDRRGQVLAHTVHADGLPALHGPKSADPLPPGVVDVGVLREPRVRPGEAFPEALDDGEVERADPDGRAEAEDEGEVDQHTQPAQDETGPALAPGLLACLEKLVHRPSGA